METQLNDEERSALATLVMRIFEDWELDAEYQKQLLGLDEATSAGQLSQYRHGAAFPQDASLLERARHVVGIQQSLHRVYSLNIRMPAFWLFNRNRQLKGMPMEIMVGEGLPGMNRVWRYLDCTVSWD